MRKMAIGLSVLGLAVCATPAMSAVLFSDQMNAASAAGWTVLSDGGLGVDNKATFGYDYSVMGIPEAPNSAGGDTATSGVRLEARLTGAGNRILNLFPNGQNFAGAHTLQFDVWMNTSILDPGSATEFVGGGIGYDGATVDIGSGVQAIMTGEGGSGSDYRAFKSDSGNPSVYFLDHPEMYGGSRNASAAHWLGYLPGGVPAPAVQGVGTSNNGTPQWQWVTMHWQTTGNGAVWMGLEKPGAGFTNGIAKVNCNVSVDGNVNDQGCTTSGNISVFYADFFGSINLDPLHQFGVVDNVIVTDLPEPASLALMGLGGLMMLRRR